MAVEDKTRFWKALRPFSFVVALSSCFLGVVLGLQHGSSRYMEAVLLVLLSGILQAAVNLVNDYSDRNNVKYTLDQKQNIEANFRKGIALLIVVIAGGSYLVSIQGLPLLLLGIVGIVGAWGYTGEPINYKRRGLGVALVFFLMGIMMIGGCYYVLTGEYHWSVFWMSLPFSFFTSLLLLSNELRDYEEDKLDKIMTLTVRIGFEYSVRLYTIMLLLIYASTLILYWQGMLSSLVMILVSLVAVPAPLKKLRNEIDQRKLLPQLTGRLYLGYSVAFLLTLWIQPDYLI